MSEIIVAANASQWSEISVFVFGIYFLGLIWWVCQPRQAERYRQYERLPLEKE